MNRAHWFASALSLALAVGCGGGREPSPLFAPWTADRGAAFAQLQQEQSRKPLPEPVAVAVGVTQTGLVGSVLPSGAPFRYRGPVDALPVITPNGIVVGTGAEQVFAIDARSGKALWRTGTEGFELRGAADDGRHTLVSLGQKGGRTGSRLIAVDRKGSLVFEREVEVDVGRPALRHGIAYLPWSGQFVSAVDLASGDEIARALLRDLVSHALEIDGQLFFGEKALVRFDERIRFSESFQATRFTFEPRALPGTPRWLDSGIAASRLDRSALAKIRLFAQPEAQARDRELGLANRAYAASYFRVVYAFSEADGRLLWTDAFAADTLGGAAAASGFVFCDASGKLRLYDTTGNGAGVIDLGEPLIGCAVAASALRVPAGTARGPLAQQIERSLARLEPDMAAAEALLVDELGRLEDPEVTRILIAFVQDERLPPAQRVKAEKLLAGRRNGVEFMLAALERHYDFVSGEQPPPVGALADALGAVGERSAAPLLARHLNDPANTVSDVERAARALETLATAAELRELSTFFALYRATADEIALVNAVLSAGSALLRVGGSEGRAVVERALTDPLTQPDVRRGLAKLVKPAAPDPQAAAQAGAAE